MRKRFKITLIALVVVSALVAGAYSLRAYRMADLAVDFEAQVRYMVENGGTIGAVPANGAFSEVFLDAMFGDNPDLLNQLKTVIRRGVEQDPDLNLGEVSAMIVTYSENDEGEVSDVVAHVVGGFPLGRLSPQFHRDGYFRHQVDENLWDMGNSMIRFLGRDMVLFADENVAGEQSGIISAVMEGDILPLVNRISKPIHYTAVLPNPRRVVPPQLRHHVQAVVMRGYLAPYDGVSETILLTASPRSANYTMSVMADMKRMAEIALRTKFKGVVQEMEWGPMIDPWWAYEMVTASENATVEREESIVRIRTEFQRAMVNATLKSIARFGRDWNMIKMVKEEGLSPKEADQLIASNKPLYYWADFHQSGPDWPIAPTEAELEERARQQEERRRQRALQQAERLAAIMADREARKEEARLERERLGADQATTQENGQLAPPAP